MTLIKEKSLFSSVDIICNLASLTPLPNPEPGGKLSMGHGQSYFIFSVISVYRKLVPALHFLSVCLNKKIQTALASSSHC